MMLNYRLTTDSTEHGSYSKDVRDVFTSDTMLQGDQRVFLLGTVSSGALSLPRAATAPTYDVLTPEKERFVRLSVGLPANTTFIWDVWENISAGNSTLSYKHSNNTEEANLAKDIPLGIVLALLCLLTVIGNVMVLHAVRTEKRLQTVSNMFIVSLAIADLTVGLIVMPISAVYIFSIEWIFGVVICQFWIGVDYTASTASILNLFILSLDRYWSVTSPLKYMRKRTKRRALIMISLAWFVSSLWLIPIIGWHHFRHGGVRKVPSNICDTEYAENLPLKIITGILNFYLPLAVMYCLYGKIFHEIRKRSQFELGQRTAGGGTREGEVTHNPNTLSGVDDSDQRNDYESDALAEHPGLKGGEQRTLIRPTTLREYETETSDDEIAKLHKSNCTNLKLMRIVSSHRRDVTSSTDPQSSDMDIKVEYVYDETVMDPTTEKVERFVYEEHAEPTDKPKRLLTIDRTAETSLNSPTSSRDSQAEKTFTYRNSRTPLIRSHKGSRSRNHNSTGIPLTKVRQRRTSWRRCGIFGWMNPFTTRSTPSIESALRKHASRWREKLVKHRHKPSAALRREIKAIKQLGVIMGAFTLCFLPYFTLFMVVAFCDGCISPELLTAMTWLGYLNSTLNPFLYALCNMNFRRKFRKMLHLAHSSDFLIDPTRLQNPTRVSLATPYDTRYDY